MSASPMISSPVTSQVSSMLRSTAWRGANGPRNSVCRCPMASWTSEGMDEFGLIDRYFAPLAKDPGALKLKDDAAFLPPRPGFDLVITTDQIAAETDFFP